MKTVKTIENEILYQSIASNFLHFSKLQKMAIIHFMELIATSIIFDTEVNWKNASRKFEYIQTIKKAFGIKEDEKSPFYCHEDICFNSVDMTLKNLSFQQKKELVLLASELIGCNGIPLYLEFIFCIRLFEQIGVTPDDFYDIVVTNFQKKQMFFATN